jgi:serine-type D-Ala-D-Ala carboxypeptidase
MAGAVVVVASKDTVLYAEAFGQRQIEPVPEAMTLDTVFDLASLTKPIAIATSTMILVDRGMLDVSNPVQVYLLEFGANGKDKVTVEQLLVHTSGLIPDNALSDYQSSVDKSWTNICALDLKSEPGTNFAYSDVNFIGLGTLIEKICGQTSDKFVTDNINAKRCSPHQRGLTQLLALRKSKKLTSVV